MFKKGEVVVYETHGVCRIDDIREEEFRNAVRRYYVLLPIYSDKTTIYAPVDNEKLFMRRALTRAEIDELLLDIPTATAEFPENENARKEYFRSIIKSGDPRRLAGLIKTLYIKKSEQEAAGRKFHLSDARFMNEAEKLLYEELALVLDIDPEKVVELLWQKLS